MLSATNDLLDIVGYDALTVDDVALRAGVHKTTVYRRWPTKPELIADAASMHSEQAISIPDTGALIEDLRLLAHDVVDNIGSAGGAQRSRSIAAAAAASDDLSEAMQGFWAHRLELTAAVVDRAVDRGEISPSIDRTLVIETVIAPLWIRLLLTGGPITHELADQVVSIVTRGIVINEIDGREG